jgi:hypothetical protein
MEIERQLQKETEMKQQANQPIDFLLAAEAQEQDAELTQLVDLAVNAEQSGKVLGGSFTDAGRGTHVAGTIGATGSRSSSGGGAGKVQMQDFFFVMR